ncbi:SDR family NAD(P)-dependent oxidoreductase [Priestia megaterium]|uniref:SDR family NAD(P)-dependent oxidoreductase n=1 Tax=Priestia megaterium TaxID=1404 RepID=UPI00285E08F4|nr:SDR family NAD(P)-dependent oxidoreductase [Priestia megaterium]MDR7242598.1 NAD(P)-dependent dehydrogenase (short-subunit alcohol dehydrogenase family) [Priestia megaterium]
MFEEKVGIITGGTSGIGLATAELLAKEGMDVVIASRNSEKGEEALSILRKWSPRSIFIKTDVTNSQDVKNLVSQTYSTFGKIDVGFNNAANTEASSSATHEFKEEDFDHLINVTLKSVWLCMKYQLQVMTKQNSGVIGEYVVNGCHFMFGRDRRVCGWKKRCDRFNEISCSRIWPSTYKN